MDRFVASLVTAVVALVVMVWKTATSVANARAERELKRWREDVGLAVKDCPVCGAAAKCSGLGDDDGGFWVRCVRIGCELTLNARTEVEAKRRWNGLYFFIEGGRK